MLATLPLVRDAHVPRNALPNQSTPPPGADSTGDPARRLPDATGVFHDGRRRRRPDGGCAAGDPRPGCRQPHRAAGGRAGRTARRLPACYQPLSRRGRALWLRPARRTRHPGRPLQRGHLTARGRRTALADPGAGKRCARAPARQPRRAARRMGCRPGATPGGHRPRRPGGADRLRGERPRGRCQPGATIGENA